MSHAKHEKIAVNRTLVGILALVCLGAAVVIGFTFPADETWNLWQGGFTRVGLLLSAFWLALPTRDREAAWANLSPSMFIAVLIVLVALVRFPIRVMLPLLVVLVVIGLIVRPRDKKRPANHASRR